MTRLEKQGLITFACILIVLAFVGLFWHQLIWKSANISHYRFHLTVSCFCTFTLGGPFPTIEVEDGKIVSMTDEKGSAITKEYEYYGTFSRYGTIDRLFSTLHSFSVLKADEVTVKYDPAYGFPSEIHIQYNKSFADDGIGLYVSGFEVLP